MPRGLVRVHGETLTMAASVRLDDEAFSDERFEVLASECGLADGDHARGKLARLWRQCTAQATYVLPERVIATVLGRSGPDALVSAGLGERVPEGIRLRGGSNGSASCALTRHSEARPLNGNGKLIKGQMAAMWLAKRIAKRRPKQGQYRAFLFLILFLILIPPISPPKGSADRASLGSVSLAMRSWRSCTRCSASSARATA